eukprot:scaffold4636_cov81-Isochrysis_galbana.AAC.4
MATVSCCRSSSSRGWKSARSRDASTHPPGAPLRTCTTAAALMVSGGITAFNRALPIRPPPLSAAGERLAEEGRRGGRLPAASGGEEAGEARPDAPADRRPPLPADRAAGELPLPGLPVAAA